MVRILITLAWLGLLFVSVFVWIPSMNVIYHGNVYFDSAEKYETFKGALANDRYILERLVVTDDGGKLVSFKIDVPREDSFPYGTRDEKSSEKIVSDCAIILGCLIGAFLSAWCWGK